MPERVTITNYTDKPVAHPGFTTIMPGQTKTRTQRVVDIDSYSEIYDRMAGAGIYVRFADTVPQGVVEPTADATLTPTQRLAVVKAGGTTVTLPKLSDVPVGKPFTIAYAEGTGTVTIAANGSETIAGSATQTLTAAGQKIRLMRGMSATDWQRA